MRATVRLIAITAVCGAATVSIDGQAPASGQRPVFRAASDMVAVDASVEVGGHAVSGLAAADFVVFDNGVKQTVDRVETASMPLDLTVIADVSGITGGAWTTRMPADKLLAEADDKIRAMAAVLRPGDRIQAIVSDTYVRLASPWTAQEAIAAAAHDGGALQVLADAPTAGLSSIYDALVAAMLEPEPLGRRHAVMAWTKSLDSLSTTDAATLKTIAYQSDAVLHVVLRGAGTTKTPNQSSPSGMSAPGSDDGQDGGFKFGFGNIGEFSHQGYAHTWAPFRRNDPDVLSAAASLTGGTFQPLGALKDTDVASTFGAIFETYRQGYVLRYAPTGVKADGWHDIVVKVPSRPGATIRARHGYGVEAGTPAAAAAVTPPARVPLVATPFESYVDLFDRRQDAALQARFRQARDLRTLIRDYRSADNPWPANPRLEAIFVLEMMTAGFLNADFNARNEARTLLDEYHDMVRAPLPPDLGRREGAMPDAQFECRWYDVAMAVLEGSAQSIAVLDLAPDFIARCPRDGRLALARAIAADQIWRDMDGRAPIFQGPRGVNNAASVMALYEEAMAFPSTALEAHVRAAWLAYRGGEFDRALTLLENGPHETADPVLGYFWHLVGAQTLRKLNRGDQAVAEYRAASDVFPGAQAARVGLMTLFIERGDRPAAEALATTVETAPDTAIDPWWVYWQGDYRSYRSGLAELRRLAEAR